MQGGKMFLALALEAATEEWRWTEVWTPPSNLQEGLVCVAVCCDMMSLWSLKMTSAVLDLLRVGSRAATE